MAVLGYAVLLILACTNMSNVFLLFLPGFFIFGANGLLTILTTVFLANSVDYGEWKNGSRDESVIFSMQTFVVKLASGVAALLASVCLAVFQTCPVQCPRGFTDVFLSRPKFSAHVRVLAGQMPN